MVSFIKKHFTYAIIAILLIVVIMQRSCSTHDINNIKTVKIGNTKYDVIKQHIDTVRIIVPRTVYKKGNDIVHEVPVYVKIPTIIDTNTVIKRYYSLNIYKDTLNLSDSLGYVSVTDSIARNAIISRTWDAKVNKFIINNTTYVKAKPKTQVYFGGTLGYQRPSLNTGVNLLLKTKKDQTYLVGAVLSSQLNPYIYGTVLWKISFKK
jgi:hypothetical protein